MTQRAISLTLFSTGHCYLRFFYLIVFKLLVLISIIQAVTTMSMSSISFPVDSSGEDKANSVLRLCPTKLWYHNETGTCWPPKVQGPCPPSLMFYPDDKVYGDCDCPREINSTVWVYDLAKDRCFKSYQQAFCKSGDWLIFTNSGEPACVANKCEKIQREKPEENEIHPVVLYNDICVRIAQSSEKGNCSSPYEILIDVRSGKPFCSSNTTYFGIGSTSNFKCRPGTRRDRLGKCRPLNSKVTFRPSSSSSSS